MTQTRHLRKTCRWTLTWTGYTAVLLTWFGVADAAGWPSWLSLLLSFVVSLLLPIRASRRELAAATWLSTGAARVLTRAGAVVAATPIWVFVVGPRLIASLAVLGMFLYGMHLATGAGVNPATNMRELVLLLQRRG